MTDIPNDPISDVQWIDRDTVRPNNYNPNYVPGPELRLLRLSIVEDGWTQPVVVRPAEDADNVPEQVEYVVVDGENRWRVSGTDELRDQYGGVIPVVVIEPDEADRRISTVRHNRARGNHKVDSMSKIVAELIRDGLSKSEIMRRLEMSEEEVNRLANRAGQSAVYEDHDWSSAWAPGEED